MSLKENNYTIWCDFIERDFLESEFQELIQKEIIHGATSNPAIFEQSITKSPSYKSQIAELKGKNTKEIYETLAITDIKRAAEILLPLYEKDQNDGFISLEVDPRLCNDAMGTIEEGVRLFNTINMPNLMIKIPATKAGYMAMRELTKMGINVNATLIFSPLQASLCAQALKAGIEQAPKITKGVVSVFVSRFDRLCDPKLDNNTKGKLGIINAMACYHSVTKEANEHIRTLFASTGVKGDEYKASYYIDELIIENSINTAPLATIKAWQTDGSSEFAPLITEEACAVFFTSLIDYGIDLNGVYDELLNDGLKAFVDSFGNLLEKLNQ